MKIQHLRYLGYYEPTANLPSPNDIIYVFITLLTTFQASFCSCAVELSESVLEYSCRFSVSDNSSKTNVSVAERDKAVLGLDIEKLK